MKSRTRNGSDYDHRNYAIFSVQIFIQTIASISKNNNLFTTLTLRLVRDEADEPLHNCAPALSEGEVVILTTQLPH